MLRMLFLGEGRKRDGRTDRLTCVGQNRDGQKD